MSVVVNACPLCILKDRRNTYLLTKEFIILDCHHCHVPMVVTLNHISPVDSSYNDLRWRMYQALYRVARTRFGDHSFVIDMRQRTIKDHLHWHARRCA